MAGALSAAAPGGAPARTPPARTPPEERPLPPLREDLRLLPGPRESGGAPTWTLHDPAANRFLRIGWLEFEILQRWGLGTAAAVAESIRRATPIAAQHDDVLEFLRFAERCEILQVQDPAASGWPARWRAAASARRSGC